METENGENVLMLRTATSTKVSTALIRKTAWALLHGRAEICIKAVTKKMRDMGMVRCTGLTVAVTKANGKMASNTE
jgi:hypothetical protein